MFKFLRKPTPQEFSAHQLNELKLEYLELIVRAELAEALVTTYQAEAEARLKAITRLEKK